MPSLDLRIQAKGTPQVDLTGVVDSGAGRTVLSIEDAEELGLQPGDLREAGEVLVADGSAVPCFAPPVPIRARVLDTVFSEDDPDPWGPIFDLDVVFLEHVTSPLWGSRTSSRPSPSTSNARSSRSNTDPDIPRER